GLFRRNCRAGLFWWGSGSLGSSCSGSGRRSAAEIGDDLPGIVTADPQVRHLVAVFFHQFELDRVLPGGKLVRLDDHPDEPVRRSLSRYAFQVGPARIAAANGVAACAILVEEFLSLV